MIKQNKFVNIDSFQQTYCDNLFPTWKFEFDTSLNSTRCYLLELLSPSLFNTVLCLSSFFSDYTALQTAIFSNCISLSFFSFSCNFPLIIQFSTQRSCFFCVTLSRHSIFFSKNVLFLSIEMKDFRFFPFDDCSFSLKLISYFLSFSVYSSSQQYFFQNFFSFRCSFICSYFYFWASG